MHVVDLEQRYHGLAHFGVAQPHVDRDRVARRESGLGRHGVLPQALREPGEPVHAAAVKAPQQQFGGTGAGLQAGVDDSARGTVERLVGAAGGQLYTGDQTHARIGRQADLDDEACVSEGIELVEVIAGRRAVLQRRVIPVDERDLDADSPVSRVVVGAERRGAAQCLQLDFVSRVARWIEDRLRARLVDVGPACAHLVLVDEVVGDSDRPAGNGTQLGAKPVLRQRAAAGRARASLSGPHERCEREGHGGTGARAKSQDARRSSACAATMRRGRNHTFSERDSVRRGSGVRDDSRKQIDDGRFPHAARVRQLAGLRHVQQRVVSCH